MAINDLKLRQFIRVCECGSMTQAAEQLYITQSALSQSMHSLEEEIGSPLWERKGRSLILNRQGEIVLQYTQEIIRMTEDMEQEVRQSLSDEKTLTIAGIDISMSSFLAAYFMLDHPEYLVAPVQSGHLTADTLLEGRKDLCMTRAPLAGEGIDSRQIFRDDQYVVVPPGSPHYGQAEASLSDFLGEEFLRSSYVLRHETAEYEGSDHLTERIAQLKMERYIQYIARPALKLMVVQDRITKNSFVSGLGMLLNESYRKIDRKRCVRLTDKELTGAYWLSYRRKNPRAQLFMRWLRAPDGAGKYLRQDGMIQSGFQILLQQERTEEE